jgi:hypothetical protein
MPEVYENIEEFVKALVDVLRPYFKGYEESEERGKKILKLTGRNRNFDILISNSKSKLYEKSYDVSIIIKQKEKRIVDTDFSVKDTYVVIHGAFKSKYKDTLIIYAIYDGFSDISGDTVEIEIKKEIKWIDINLYD